MAEIQVNSKQSGVRRSKKLSTKVDLTPMVDLGFLLITFFIITTTMAQPGVMKLYVPKDDHVHGMPVPASGTLILLPTVDTVYYYEGKYTGRMQHTSYKGIRSVIIDKKKRTPSEELFVIIKPLATANYQNMVTIMDEMLLNDVRRYSLWTGVVEEVPVK